MTPGGTDRTPPPPRASEHAATPTPVSSLVSGATSPFTGCAVRSGDRVEASPSERSARSREDPASAADALGPAASAIDTGRTCTAAAPLASDDRGYLLHGGTMWFVRAYAIS